MGTEYGAILLFLLFLTLHEHLKLLVVNLAALVLVDLNNHFLK